MIERLERSFGEYQAAIGVSEDGQFATAWFVSTDDDPGERTWTIVVTEAGADRSCIKASGKGFIAVWTTEPKKPKGRPS